MSKINLQDCFTKFIQASLYSSMTPSHTDSLHPKRQHVGRTRKPQTSNPSSQPPKSSREIARPTLQTNPCPKRPFANARNARRSAQRRRNSPRTPRSSSLHQKNRRHLLHNPRRHLYSPFPYRLRRQDCHGMSLKTRLIRRSRPPGKRGYGRTQIRCRIAHSTASSAICGSRATSWALVSALVRITSSIQVSSL